MTRLHPWCLLGCGLAACLRAGAEPVVSQLTATFRHGQVFLTWHETATPAGTTFNVYVASSPIRQLGEARRIGHDVEAGSATDWWEDPASFSRQKPSDRSHGFRIVPGAPGLDPAGGLFVHTVAAGSEAPLFFAVTPTSPEGREDRTLVPGSNSTTAGVSARAEPVEPIWQGRGVRPVAGAGQGLPLWLNLHAKGGIIAESEFLVFGDGSLGWREGLPFKFSVRLQNGEVVVRPTDRVWINRPHHEAPDGGTPAIWTFWYGYNSNIHDRAAVPQGVPTNYTERRLLWILNWVGRHYRPDPNRWYCSGSSMGGCGTISFGMRHPELFAACHAHVPIVSYTYQGAVGSARRLEPSCWDGRIGEGLPASDAPSLLERMDGTRQVSRAAGDLPYLFIINGRQDGSIPWVNNPPFYRALDAAGQGFSAFWDDGRHDTSGKSAPDDVKGWLKAMRRFRLNESFPAFSGTTDNRDPGRGDPREGDLVGWMNRGLDWSEPEDTADHYAITLRAAHPDLAYPVGTTVTLRRVQHFRPEPGTRLQVELPGGRSRTVTVDPQGRIRIPGITIPNADGVRVIVRRA